MVCTPLTPLKIKATIRSTTLYFVRCWLLAWDTAETPKALVMGKLCLVQALPTTSGSTLSKHHEVPLYGTSCFG